MHGGKKRNNWLNMRIVAVNCYSQFIKNHLRQPLEWRFCLLNYAAKGRERAEESVL